MSFWKKSIYADAAASTPISRESRRELDRLLNYFGNPGALHSRAVALKHEIEHARDVIAKTIGAHYDEIVFSASGTEANNLAIHGVLRPLLHAHGELHAITSAIEHQSILEPLRALERDGLYVTELVVDREGLIDPKTLADAITDETVFVTIQMVNSEIGTIEAIRDIVKEVRRIKKARTNGLPLYVHTDASQAPLWVPVAVEKLGVDLLTLDAQKVLGPKGVGALYVRRGVVIEPILFGGAQERGLRGGTENVPSVGAFAVALAAAQVGVEARAEKISQLRNSLFEEIQNLLPDVVLNGPSLSRDDLASTRVANNLNISIPRLDGQMAVIAMDREGIAISTRSACNTDEGEPSHVLVAVGAPRDVSQGAIRITLLPSITRAEVKHIARTLAKVAARYRS